MTYSSKSIVELGSVKLMVEKALSHLLRAEVEVDSNDCRLGSILAEIEEGNLTEDEAIMALVKKYYILSYLESKAVVEDDDAPLY